MKKTVFCLVLVLALGVMVFAAEKVNISGTWKLTIQSPRGERVQDYVFVQDGEKIAVTWQGRDNEEMKAEGTIKGSEIQWSVTRETPMGTFTITYKGTVEGDTMKGTAEMGPDRTFEWKGEKVKVK